ncbi:MAG: radical SAM protein [Porphyromonas sp.]|nr:radical SAM protein [Porphyromonas sp.]
MKYIFNHYYKLRNDSKRCYILSQNNIDCQPQVAISSGWISVIHPIYAIMLSVFSTPIDLGKACREISELISIREEEIGAFIKNLIETKEPLHSELGEGVSGFPVGLIIPENNAFMPPRLYEAQSFLFKDVDLKRDRPFNAPLSIVIMPTNKCVTKCAYCYADTETQYNEMPLSRIKEIVEEAVSLGVGNLILTGGDIFTYKNWKELVTFLCEKGYKPDLLSTKYPLKKSDIELVKKLGIRVQISLDSLSANTQKSMLGVKSQYSVELIKSIKLLDEMHMHYQIATVLTNYNDNIPNLESLKNFIEKLNNIERWEVRVGFRSLYSRASFDLIKSKRESIGVVEQWVENVRLTSKLNILWSPDQDGEYRTEHQGSRFFKGARCSANMSNMIILPDGKVTICEQLYWLPEFIIGDLSVPNTSISDVWNSSRAKDLYHFIPKKSFSQSPCSMCKNKEDCFSYGNRCLADIIKAYGREAWDYPDPRCIHAPQFDHSLCHD